MPGFRDAFGERGPGLVVGQLAVSDTVSTAIFSGTNCLLSSMPGMAVYCRVGKRACRDG
jgi:hypothetical protein